MNLLLLCFVVVGGLLVNAKSISEEWFPIPLEADVAKKPLDAVLHHYGPQHKITFTSIYGSVESSRKFKVNYMKTTGGGTVIDICVANVYDQDVDVRECNQMSPVGGFGRKLQQSNTGEERK